MNSSLIAVIIAVIGIASADEPNHPWEPSFRTEAKWQRMHESLVNLTADHPKDIEIVFIGDSITEMWATNGKNVWNRWYLPRHAYNYSIGGDQTRHLIYRIPRELDNKDLKPRTAVLMIGTNNLVVHDRIEDIAHGVKEVLIQLEAKLEKTKIILLGVLPRKEPWGSKAKQLNALLSKLADNKTVFWLDMWRQFANDDDSIKADLFAGDVHLVEKGYEVWQQTMEPLLEKLDPSF